MASHHLDNHHTVRKSSHHTPFRYHHTVCLGLGFTKTPNSDKYLVAAETKVKLSKISIPRFWKLLHRSKEGWSMNLLNIWFEVGFISKLIKQFIFVSGSIHKRFQQHCKLHCFAKCLKFNTVFQKGSWKLSKSLVKTNQEVPTLPNFLLAIFSFGIATEDWAKAVVLFITNNFSLKHKWKEIVFNKSKIDCWWVSLWVTTVTFSAVFVLTISSAQLVLKLKCLKSDRFTNAGWCTRLTVQNPLFSHFLVNFLKMSYDMRNTLSYSEATGYRCILK